MKFYGQRQHDKSLPPPDQTLYERYFKNRAARGVFLEVGAYDGSTEPNGLFFERELGWICINLEPSLPLYRRLCKNRPEAVNLMLALSDRIGISTIWQPQTPDGRLPGHGTIDAGNIERVKSSREYKSVKPMKVLTITYPDLMEIVGVSVLNGALLPSIDIFSLDTEGHELPILSKFWKGMPAAWMPKVICVETTYAGLDNLKNILVPLGYKHDHTAFENAYFIR